MSRKKSFKKSSALVLDPLGTIDFYKNKEDWFPAFANAVAYFEYYGFWAISAHCRRNSVKLTRKGVDSLKELGVGNICLLMQILKLIDDQTYSNMKKIIEERNKLVHPSRKGIMYREQKQKERATSLLNQAKDSINRIRSTIRSD